MSTCNRLDFQTLGSQPIMHAQKSPRSLVSMTPNSYNEHSYHRGFSIPTKKELFFVSLKFCHVSLLHWWRPSWISHGNYTKYVVQE